MSWLLLALRLGLAGVLAIAAFAKLADRGATRAAVRGFGVPQLLVGPTAWAVPLCELALAALLVPAPTARVGAIGAVALLALFSVALLRAPTADCNCFGALAGPSGGRRALARNGVLGAVGVVVAWAGAGVGLSELDATEGLLVAALAVIAALGVAVWALLAQNRRLLADRPSGAGEDAAPQPSAPRAPDVPSRLPPVGTPAPRFALTDAAGAFHTLDDLLVEGLAVALVFSDPSCSACDGLPALLARLRAERAGEMEFALVTRAPVEPGPFAPILLQGEGHEVARAYGAGHMPSAVIIDPDGRIASALAVGDLAIERLVMSQTPEVHA